MFDSPVVAVVRRAEDLALKTGAEAAGFLSFTNGFLPMLYVRTSLSLFWFHSLRIWLMPTRNEIICSL